MHYDVDCLVDSVEINAQAFALRLGIGRYALLVLEDTLHLRGDCLDDQNPIRVVIRGHPAWGQGFYCWEARCLQRGLVSIWDLW